MLVSGFRCSTFSLAGGLQIRVSLPVDTRVITCGFRVSLRVSLRVLPVDFVCHYLWISLLYLCHPVVSGFRCSTHFVALRLFASKLRG